MKKNKGVTLIALIIMIIVLLILAGITLSMVVRENGIISKAIIARDKTNKAQEIEENNLEDLENQMQKYITTRNPNINMNLKTDGTEVDTGSTYNGKKLYRRCLTLKTTDFTIINTGTYGNIPSYELNNIEDVFIEYDFSYYVDVREKTHFPLNYYDGYTAAICNTISKDEKKYIIINNNHLWPTNENIRITILYTKK